MKELAENNLIRFKNISRKKDTMTANFKVKGLRGGVNFTASILSIFRPQSSIRAISSKRSLKSVPASACVSLKRPTFNLKGSQQSNLGVAQLG